MRSVVLFVMLSLGAGGVGADVRPPEVPYDNHEYNGQFTFVRLRFDPVVWGPGPFLWGLDLKWNHDYPWAEENLARILEELTTLTPTPGGNIIDVDDPALFDYPLAYLCEPGFWEPTDEETVTLRSYLLKGGFLIVDDFMDPYLKGPQWRNFEYQIRRVLPGAKLFELEVTHPVFGTFFHLEDLDFTHPKLPYLQTQFFGIFEDNDPEGRLMMVANYNNDIGDYWEWSDQPNNWYPIDLTKKGFQLGVNYILYSFVH
ncbi:MAG: DUF4159 domain-containing protein [Acidobacteriota bacterium]|nr:DUF4159 domain-containing protein [Acidobacteriota bacterium]